MIAKQKKVYGILLFVFFILTCNNVPPITPTPPAITPTPTPHSPSTFHVNGRIGSDANPGSRALPWRTIQKAANSLNSGDIVIVETGSYNERVVINRSGSDGAPITFQAQEAVVMWGFTVQANYITIRGFEITNTPDNSRDGMGVWIQGSNCLIEDNYIHYATRGGILLFAEPESEDLTASCVVRNNRLFRNSQFGIDVRGRNHLIENNEVWGTIQHHPDMAVQPGWVDADGIHFHGSGHIFRGNYIHDILYSAPENVNPHIDCFQTFLSLPDQEAASNIIFEQNRCEIAYDEHGSGFMLNGASQITIRNNIINTYVGVNGQYSSGLTIINNTFTSDVSLSTAYYPAGITFTSVSDSILQNNIFYNLPGILFIWSKQRISAQKKI